MSAENTIQKRLAELRQIEAEWAGKSEFPAPAKSAIDWVENLLVHGELGPMEGLCLFPLLQGGVEIVWETTKQGENRLEISIEIEAVPDDA